MKRIFSRSVRNAASYLCASLALAACVDFELIAPRVFPPQLSMYLRLEHDSVSSWDLQATWYDPGMTLGDATLAQLALVVNGDTLEATRAGTRVDWHGQISSPRNEPDTLRIVLPRMTSAQDAGTLVIPLAHSDTSYRTVLTTGEPLHLHVSPVPSAPDLATEVYSWELRVGKNDCSGGSSRDELYLRGGNVYPSDLVVPWSLLLPLQNVINAACFRAFESIRVTGTPYQLFVNQSVRILWQVEVRPPSP